MRHNTIDNCSSNAPFMDLQIPADLPLKAVCDQRSTNPIHLYKYTDIPAFLQGNPWVVEGYRTTLPFYQCCQRVLYCLKALSSYSPSGFFTAKMEPFWPLWLQS